MASGAATLESTRSTPSPSDSSTNVPTRTSSVLPRSVPRVVPDGAKTLVEDDAAAERGEGAKVPPAMTTRPGTVPLRRLRTCPTSGMKGSPAVEADRATPRAAGGARDGLPAPRACPRQLPGRTAVRWPGQAVLPWATVGSAGGFSHQLRHAHFACRQMKVQSDVRSRSVAVARTTTCTALPIVGDRSAPVTTAVMVPASTRTPRPATTRPST